MSFIKTIDHIVITTNDLNACLLFYEKLGFQILKKEGYGEIHAASFKINVHQKGAERLPCATHVTVGSQDFCFELATTLEKYVSYLHKQTIEIELGPIIRYGKQGKMRSIYLRDIDGNLLEFSQYEENTTT